MPVWADHVHDQLGQVACARCDGGTGQPVAGRGIVGGERPEVPGPRARSAERVAGDAAVYVGPLGEEAAAGVAGLERSEDVAAIGAEQAGVVAGDGGEVGGIKGADLTPRPPLRRGEGETALLLPLSAPERGSGGEVTWAAPALQLEGVREPEADVERLALGGGVERDGLDAEPVQVGQGMRQERRPMPCRRCATSTSTMPTQAMRRP